MRTTLRHRLTAVAITTGAVVAATTMAGLAAPAQASVDTERLACLEQEAGPAAAARGGNGPDHRDVSATEQRAISARTESLLKGTTAAGGQIPVYVHVMAGADGEGNVSDAQIAAQIAVLNETFSGAEDVAAPVTDTGFTFVLAATDRFYNDSWHADKASSKYRKATRRGGADALNIWLVDFTYLGIATFPWDYARSGEVDGVRVHYGSLPGGDIADYNQGETATHEVGHWLGLYHTFQGGCTQTNDEVLDTPAQAGPTSGCPAGADTCPLPGLDPIHNYMDYSYDTCYFEFSPEQATRMQQMWTAYRAVG